SMFSIAGPIGAVLGGLAVDIMGRKRIIIASHCCMFFGWLIITSAQNGDMIVIGRIMEGIARCVGATAST
ncbi:hypothetical protein L9F63_004324, partial [Diploptera punctata]